MTQRAQTNANIPNPTAVLPGICYGLSIASNQSSCLVLFIWLRSLIAKSIFVLVADNNESERVRVRGYRGDADNKYEFREGSGLRRFGKWTAKEHRKSPRNEFADDVETVRN